MRKSLSLAAVVAALFVMTSSSGSHASLVCDRLLEAYQAGLSNKAYAQGNGRGCGYSTGRLHLEGAKSQAMTYCESGGAKGCRILYSQGQGPSGTRILGVSVSGAFKRQ
jgi:hypothetical protein